MNFSLVRAVLRRHVLVFDPALLLVLLLIAAVSCITMYSAAYENPDRLGAHMRNLALSFLVMWFVANLSPTTMMRVAIPLYLTGIALLIGVALFGDISKGARRWLHIGVTRIQPSEVLKIAMPLMLAWYFHRYEAVARWRHYIVSMLLLAVPVVLIARQPDLGTSILVFAAGAYVIFFAGLSWKVIFGSLIAAIAGLPLLWSVMKEYQRQRVLTMIDPTTDPLGKGFHIIQSMIAVGSGGTSGKGLLQGTQTHLEFIPERTTDFIFSVYAEEFGLIGTGVLLVLYLTLIGRGLMIAADGTNAFTRLLAGAVAMIFFTYAFVNMGMVTGILPVVGVPLPLMSYGGTAMVTLGLGAGILMAVARHNRLARAEMHRALRGSR
ncbi:MAG: rod shape-determining protein RodA [Lautropia sp.]